MTATSLLRRHAVDTRPMQMPPYRRLLIGQGTAFIGSMLSQVAVPVQVYAISHSSLYVGLVGLAGLLPIVIFGLYGGAIADAARGGDGRGHQRNDFLGRRWHRVRGRSDSGSAGRPVVLEILHACH